MLEDNPEKQILISGRQKYHHRNRSDEEENLSLISPACHFFLSAHLMININKKHYFWEKKIVPVVSYVFPFLLMFCILLLIF